MLFSTNDLWCDLVLDLLPSTETVRNVESRETKHEIISISGIRVWQGVRVYVLHFLHKQASNLNKPETVASMYMVLVFTLLMASPRNQEEYIREVYTVLC